jgi:hypothetical protein
VKSLIGKYYASNPKMQQQINIFCVSVPVSYAAAWLGFVSIQLILCATSLMAELLHECQKDRTEVDLIIIIVL